MLDEGGGFRVGVPLWALGGGLGAVRVAWGSCRIPAFISENDHRIELVM